jgi:hypothetical protein
MHINKALSMMYEIHNLSDEVMETVINIEENEDFYIGGEIKSSVSIMPQSSYEFVYNLIPL